MSNNSIPFITLNSSTGLYEVSEQSRRFLQSLKGNIGVVTIAGKYRTGKSFLLNRCILNQPIGSGFNVGSTIQACTKGIWISQKTIRCEENGEKFEAIVMDTEGLMSLDADATHDSRVFSLALLLSSYFIFNSVGSIDQTAIENLSLVSNISKHIRINAKNEATTDELGQVFPKFLWTVRDFSLRLVDEENNVINSHQYFENALKGDDSIRTALRKSFPKRTCVTMVRPCNNEKDLQIMDTEEVNLRPEFVSDMMRVRNILAKDVPKKRVMHKEISGPMLFSLAESYVTAINNGVAPAIKDSWALLSEARCRQCVDDCMLLFDSSVKNAKVGMSAMSYEKLDSILNGLVESSLEMFETNAIEEFRKEYGLKLQKRLETAKARIHKYNWANADKLLYKTLNKVSDKMNELTSLDDMHKVYIAETRKVVQTLGEKCAKRWKNLVSENIWSWVKKLLQTLNVQSKQIQDTLIQTQKMLKATQVDFNSLEQHSSEQIEELKQKLNKSTITCDKQSEVLQDQKEQLETLQRESWEKKELESQEHKDKVEELDAKILGLTESLAVATGNLDLMTKLLEQKQSEYDALKARTDEELVNNNDSLTKLQISYEEKSSEVERLNTDAKTSNHVLEQLKQRVGESELESNAYEKQIQELNTTTEEIIGQVRTNANKERLKFKSDLDELSTQLNKKSEEYKHLDETMTQKVNAMELLLESSRESVSRQKQDLESARQELTRVTSQWENQHESHKDMIKVLEVHWKDDIVGRKKEFDELQQTKRSEQLDITKKLKETESELLCTKTLLKDNKRRLVDAEERATNKKLKTEHHDVQSKLLKTTVELDYLRKSERENQQKVKELTLTNIQLERKCKDFERKRQVDLLKMRLEYEQQISSLQH